MMSDVYMVPEPCKSPNILQYLKPDGRTNQSSGQRKTDLHSPFATRAGCRVSWTLTSVLCFLLVLGVPIWGVEAQNHDNWKGNALPFPHGKSKDTLDYMQH